MKHPQKIHCTLITALFAAVAMKSTANAFVPSSHFSIGSKHLITFSHQNHQCSKSSRPVIPTFLYMSTSSSAALPDARSMRVSELKKELESYGMSTKSYLEKSELVQAVEKARAEGKIPINVEDMDMGGTTASSTTETSTSSSSSSSPESTGMSRYEQIAKEIEKCNAMKAGELKKELESYGISTASFFEKSEFVQACAEARVDGVSKKTTNQNTGSSAKSTGGEGYAEYADVEVITDDYTGPRNNSDGQQQPRKGTGMRSGGPGIGNPFAGPGMNMGFMQDMMKNMGGMGGMGGGGNPFGGSAASNPFGG
mmetsp:Transcript_10916/g.20397  ORF Transcript_10916/g.20397 Transcript_10916/m.20397 type:complete len:311 (+) Transcript_10916:238-1170(+)